MDVYIDIIDKLIISHITIIHCIKMFQLVARCSGFEQEEKCSVVLELKWNPPVGM